MRHHFRSRIVCFASLVLLAETVAGCSAETADKSANDPIASTTPTSSPTTMDLDSPPRLDELVDGALDAGAYALPPLGPGDTPVAVVDVPEGYEKWGPFLNAPEPVEPEDPLSISLWVVTGVFKDACLATEQFPAGSSVRTLADSLARQKVTSTTKPRAVTLAGYDGLYLEITIPTDVDLSKCNDVEINTWEATPAGERWTRMHGMVDRVWILNVDGQPMVLTMFVPPSATPSQIARLTDILKTARFIEG